MSADNGVFILASKGNEFRVAHAQAFYDNYHGAMKKGKSAFDSYVLSMYGGCTVFNDLGLAFVKAKEILKELVVCEYGICVVDYDDNFPEVTHA